MPLIIHERIGHEGRRPSPFSWRIYYAVRHKGIEVEYRAVRFADVATIRSLSGQDKVPILVDGDRVIHDSWNIATYLEQRHADRPSLFGGAVGLGLSRVLNQWADHALGPAVRRLIAADFIYCLAPEDRAYYRRSREAAFGCTLEEYCTDRVRWLDEFAVTIAPLEQTLKEQAFLAGEAPGYADYIVFSTLQYARLGSPHELLAQGTAARRWRDSIAALFDGLGDRWPAYPARQDGPDGR
jgi:glutathione S-transferase